MPTATSARDRARALLTADIVRTARRQLAREGAAGISLRGVARELELTPSALYRYFLSRDELLTQLIVEAYDSLGSAATSAGAAGPPEDVGRRWLATCRAVRQWAQERPHEYALVYGSPVPGYEAPERTIGPASQVPLALLRILADAHAHGRLALPASPDPSLPDTWAADADRMIEEFMHGVPPRAVVRAFVAWSQLFGLVSFELFGHLVGSVSDPAVLFDASVAMMGAFVGLPPPDGSVPGRARGAAA